MLNAMGVAVGAVTSVVALKQGKEYGEKGLNDGQKFHREAQEKTEGALFTPCFALASCCLWAAQPLHATRD